MALEEIVSKLSVWMINVQYVLNPTPFVSNLSYIYQWIRICIPNAETLCIVFQGRYFPVLESGVSNIYNWFFLQCSILSIEPSKQ